jgi:hypothetical protein
MDGYQQLGRPERWSRSAEKRDVEKGCRSLITWIGGGLLCIPLYPFPAARTNPGHERVGQALRFCLSDLVRMKGVPAARGSRICGIL